MQEVRGQLPGIALSGYGTDQDQQRSIEAGFAVHLTKPTPAHLLEQVIRHVLSGDAVK